MTIGGAVTPRAFNIEELRYPPAGPRGGRPITSLRSTSFWPRPTGFPSCRRLCSKTTIRPSATLTASPSTTVSPNQDPSGGSTGASFDQRSSAIANQRIAVEGIGDDDDEIIPGVRIFDLSQIDDPGSGRAYRTGEDGTRAVWTG